MGKAQPTKYFFVEITWRNKIWTKIIGKKSFAFFFLYLNSMKKQYWQEAQVVRRQKNIYKAKAVVDFKDKSMGNDYKNECRIAINRIILFLY